MDITAIRKGIQGRLATIVDPNNSPALIRTSYNVPDNVQLPLAFVGLPTGAGASSDVVEYDLTYLGGSHRAHFVVKVLVTKWDNVRAQDLLDPYLGNGASSVYAAISGDRTLGGLALDAVVKRAMNFGQHEVNGAMYLGCAFHIEVLVNA